MTTLTLLELFQTLAKGETKHWGQHVHWHQERYVATDGRLLFWHKATPALDDYYKPRLEARNHEALGDKVPPMIASYENRDGLDYQSPITFDRLPYLALTCSTCMGTGLLQDCARCHGDGEHECALCHHLEDCEDCAGSGLVAVARGRGFSCIACGGSTKAIRQGGTLQPFEISKGWFIRLYYLGLLWRTFGDVSFHLPLKQDQPIMISFPESDSGAILMPVLSTSVSAAAAS